MRVLTKALLVGLIMFVPVALSAQRVGLSVNAVGSPSAGSASAAAPRPNTPQLPPLPGPLPAPSTVSLPSLQLGLKPLNLVSNHLAPSSLLLPPVSKPAAFPAVPFAIDPILARGLPQVCVDPKALGPTTMRVN